MSNHSQKADRNAPEEVDAWLSEQVPEFRNLLESVREVIKKNVSGVKERIAYRIPVFRTTQDFLALSCHKSHCSVHTMSHNIPEKLKSELKKYTVSGTTIHMTPENPLTEDLVIRIIREREKEMAAE